MQLTVRLLTRRPLNLDHKPLSFGFHKKMEPHSQGFGIACGFHQHKSLPPCVNGTATFPAPKGRDLSRPPLVQRFCRFTRLHVFHLDHTTCRFFLPTRNVFHVHICVTSFNESMAGNVVSAFSTMQIPTQVITSGFD